MLALTGFFTFVGCGSESSDISSVQGIENPLPPCPDSPNCLRITKQFDQPVKKIYDASLQTIRDMDPEELTEADNQQKIESVFRVVFFRDDMALQFTDVDSNSTFLHIRSASRVGESDLGVNRRRVQQFLEKLQPKLPGNS